MDNTFTDLYNEFLALVNKGDEAGARKFLVENLNKFPEEAQDKITFSFFEEALMKETEGVQEIADMQKQGLDAMSQIEKAKKVLEEQLKVRDLKNKLTQ